jgi:hypothetical protein
VTLLLYSVAIAKIAITPPPKTKRSIPNGWKPRSFATLAVNKRHIRKLNNREFG